MHSHLLTIDGVGPVLFERSHRARRVNITVKPPGRVRVAVPVGVSFQKAREFALSKRDWIRKHRLKMQGSERNRRALSAKFNNIDRRMARQVLVQRLDMLAARYGFSYNRVFVRNQKTRWGSCSAENNISLNAKLVRLPEFLMDYIIIHELVHTKVKNHGSAFYAALNRIVGDWKSLDRQLKDCCGDFL